MGLDRERIAATYAAGAGDGLVGSGYFVTDGLVLTAAHGVGSIGDPAQVKRLDGDWLPAKVVWRGETSDSALVELALPSDRPRFHTAIRWGRIEGPDRVSCTAVGFPWAEARPENLRDSHQLYGDIAPLTGRKSRRYAINVTTAPPAGRPPGRSPWAGMSGAAVTAGGVVVGVVVIDPERFGADRLDAVPIEEIFAEEAFAERVGGGGLPSLESVGSDHVVGAEGFSFVLRSPFRAAPPDDELVAAPVNMLFPEFGLVPFLGRAEILEGVDEWCDSDRQRGVRVVTGEGGAGKSRFVAEVCRRLGALDWATGIVDRGRLGKGEGEPLDRDSVLVIDNAEGQTDLIIQLISRLREIGRARIRVLIVAWGLGAWFEQVQRNAPELSGFVGAELTLGREALTDPQREEHYEAASRAFAAHLDRSPPSADGRVLERSELRTPLLVHMSALLDVLEGETPGARSVFATRHEVLQTLLRQEKVRWTQAAKESGLPGLDPIVLDRVIAVATLAPVTGEDRAAEVLKAVPDLKDADEERRRGIARLVRDIYPGDRYFNAIRPEILAAQHLAQVLSPTEVPDDAERVGLAGEVFDRLTEAERSTMVATMSRAARDDPGLAPLVDRLAHAKLADLLALWQTLIDSGRKEEAAERLSNLDWGHLIWRGEAERIRDLRKALEGTVDDPRQRAFQELSMGAICRILGPMSEAILRFEHAAAAFHELRDREMQARAEHDLGETCRVSGRFEEAAAHLGMARSLFDELGNHVEESNCLAQLALLRSYQGHPDEAVRLVEEGLRLVGGYTGDDAVHPTALLHDAGSLALFLQRDLDRARSEIDAAIASYRHETQTYGIAYVLNVRGMIELMNGDLDAAAATMQESIALARQAKYPRLQGLSLFNQAMVEVAGNRPDAGVELAERAVKILEELAAPEQLPARDLLRGLRALRVGDRPEFEQALRDADAHSDGMPDIYPAAEILRSSGAASGAGTGT